MTLLVGRQEGHPACKKTEWWGAGMVICLERGADLHMFQLMPLPLTVSCFSKIQIGFAFLVPAHLGSHGKMAVKRVCVCLKIMTSSSFLYYIYSVTGNQTHSPRGSTRLPWGEWVWLLATDDIKRHQLPQWAMFAHMHLHLLHRPTPWILTYVNVQTIGLRRHLIYQFWWAIWRSSWHLT